MIAALNSIEVITLFVEDLRSARKFYGQVFATQTVYEDEVSTVMSFGSLMLNLLQASEAGTLVAPAAVANPASGSRVMFTIKVEDTEAVCAKLAESGVTLLNGRIDRPWGRRTAAFADPSGHVWEVALELPGRQP